MATVSWNSDFRPCAGVRPFIVLGTMLSEQATRFPQLFVKLIVLHKFKELFCLIDNAKVAQMLHICKYSGNFFATFSILFNI